MIGVDDLRDDDEAHGSARGARERQVDELARVLRELVGRRVPVGVAHVGSLPSRSARSRSESTRVSSARAPRVSAGGIRMPSTPSVDQVENAAGGGGDDAAPARERLDHDAPEPLGPRRQHEHRCIVELAAATSAGASCSWYSTCSGTSRRSSSTTCRARALADDHEARVRHRDSDAAPGARRARRCSCTPPASRRRRRRVARAAAAPARRRTRRGRCRSGTSPLQARRAPPRSAPT